MAEKKRTDSELLESIDLKLWRTCLAAFVAFVALLLIETVAISAANNRKLDTLIEELRQIEECGKRSGEVFDELRK